VEIIHYSELHLGSEKIFIKYEISLNASTLKGVISLSVSVACIYNCNDAALDTNLYHQCICGSRHTAL
jgi:hypothetical protein